MIDRCIGCVGCVRRTRPLSGSRQGQDFWPARLSLVAPSRRGRSSLPVSGSKATRGVRALAMLPLDALCALAARISVVSRRVEPSVKMGFYDILVAPRSDPASVRSGCGHKRGRGSVNGARPSAEDTARGPSFGPRSYIAAFPRGAKGVRRVAQQEEDGRERTASLSRRSTFLDDIDWAKPTSGVGARPAFLASAIR